MEGKGKVILSDCGVLTVQSIYLYELTTVGLLELRINDNNNNNNVLKPTTMHCTLHLRLKEILNVQNVFFKLYLRH
jgi:hypothetical protein